MRFAVYGIVVRLGFLTILFQFARRAWVDEPTDHAKQPPILAFGAHCRCTSPAFVDTPSNPVTEHRSDRPRITLFAIGAGWLLLMATLIWLHARQSTQPPVYDALGYFAKSKFVWTGIANGDFGHLLAAEPALRPPATVLMAFPFGFDGTFPGFYFRSVFFPVVLVFVAVCIVAWRPGHSQRESLLTALTGCFLSTLSLFFYFEPYDGRPPGISYWGLVDCFQTGLAAVAAACAVRSVRMRSIGWCFASTFVAFLMIFVKPSGTLLAALVGMVLTIGWLLLLSRTKAAGAQRRAAFRSVAALVVVQCVVLGGALLLAINSPYLGAESMQFGKASMQVMRSEIHLDLWGFVQLVPLGLGPFIPIWILAALALLAYDFFAARLQAPQRALDRLFAVMSVVVFFAGAWFWLVESGGLTQIRYFTPFLYISVICIVGPVLRILAGIGWQFRWLMMLLMLVAVGNTLLLLAVPSPSMAWQVVSGVNVMSGSKQQAIAQAQMVVDALKPGSKAPVVYSMSVDMSDAMFNSVFHLHNLDPNVVHPSVRRPLDWQRPTAFRSEELVDSDYILFDPRKARDVLPDAVDDYATEEIVFQSWAKGLTSDDGVEVVSVGPESTLLRIVDPVRLRASVAKLLEAHRWRAIFMDANAPTWWSAQEIETAIATKQPAVEGVRFSDKIEVRAATLEAVGDKAVELRVWLRSIDRSDETGWIMLVHYVDAAGNILYGPDYALPRMGRETDVKPYFLVRRTSVPPPGTTNVAVGIYRGNEILLADKGTVDWGGKRVLLPLPNGRTSP